MLDLVLEIYLEALLLGAFAISAQRINTLYLTLWTSWTFSQFVAEC